MTPPFLTAGRAVTVAALASVAALLSACTSSSNPSPHPSTSSGSAAPPGTGSATPSTAPSSPAQGTSHTAPVSQQSCATRDLAARTGRSEGAAGSTYVQIVFTNNSNATCTLYGYPGVALAGGSPVGQIGVAADENPTTPRQLVTLAPGAAASAQLRVVSAQNFPAARCHAHQTRFLQVYPPNQTTPIYVPFTSTACAKPVHLLVVDVVKQGAGG
jgi:hypothetical protein